MEYNQGTQFNRRELGEYIIIVFRTRTEYNQGTQFNRRELGEYIIIAFRTMDWSIIRVHSSTEEN